MLTEVRLLAAFPKCQALPGPGAGHWDDTTAGLRIRYKGKPEDFTSDAGLAPHHYPRLSLPVRRSTISPMRFNHLRVVRRRPRPGNRSHV